MFEDRREAGGMLAERLSGYARKDVIILAIPRGGVVIADEVAKKIGADLDLIIPRKLGSPYDPEYAIGAVGPDRSFLINKDAARETGATKDYIEKIVRIESIEIDRRMKKYRGSSEFVDVSGKVVIVIDDGIATGYTMKVVVDFLKKMKAKKVVVAVPVAPAEAIRKLKKDVDEIVCLETPPDFHAIGEHYKSFPQVSDDEVIRIMNRHKPESSRE